MQGYIYTCKEKDNLVTILKGRVHLLEEKNLYSLQDLVEIHNNVFSAFLIRSIQKFAAHIQTCMVKKKKRLSSSPFFFILHY
jgi:hypothetical protein